ncbi:MAG TPA: DUF3048 domain-containing protein [Chloroflexota bacterium]|nr:DUF3048 domain-containing protein [Chloroflexota bacterium]
MDLPLSLVTTLLLKLSRLAALPTGTHVAEQGAPMPARHAAPRYRPVAAAVALLLLATACQGQSPPPAPTADSAQSAPSPKPAAVGSPSPGLSAASPGPSPSAAPSPSPAVASGSGLTLDDYPFAVMIDNIAEARPHFGLANADVVYEAPAEAGIPRLMPIYLRAGGNADSIGPVRSTRHYFVYLANEYRTPLVHIGASPQGFDALSATGLPDVDEARGDGGFVRVQSRQAPHNAFVSTNSIREVLRQRGGPVKATTGPLTFGNYLPGQQPATTIKIPYPGPEGYSVEYDYDAAQKVYRRIMDGQPHRDGSTGEQYTASSIVVEFADVQPIPNDTAGRVDVGLVGTGKGVLIAQGTQVPLQWSRGSVREATQFKRADGAPFVVPTGQVWIQIVPLETQLSVS